MHICMCTMHAQVCKKTCEDHPPIRPEPPQPGSTAGSAGSWHGQNVMLWPSFSWFEGTVTAVLPSQLWFAVNCPFSRVFVLTIHCFLVESLWVSWVFVWLVNFTLVWSELYILLYLWWSHHELQSFRWLVHHLWRAQKKLMMVEMERARCSGDPRGQEPWHSKKHLEMLLGWSPMEEYLT